MEPRNHTILHGIHDTRGAKLVTFGDWQMPLHYGSQIEEHHAVRENAGLFDVSHMGQATLTGAGADAALETLVPADILGLGDRRQRYTQFTDAAGGILDDLMVVRRGADLFLIVNAARKDADFAHLGAHLPGGVALRRHDDRALLAVQGPGAAAVVARLAPALAGLAFMQGDAATIEGAACFATRSGYTGEDGFEISVPGEAAERVAKALLAAGARPAGLGARDSLRLEAGLCLYGHDIDETTTPVEAGLAWSIGKRRRAEGGFPGAAIVQDQLKSGPRRKRVGIRPDGRAPAREGAAIADAAGAALGAVTSGGFAPSLGAPIAMGYVPAAAAAPQTPVNLIVRGAALPARIVPMPFVPHRYAK